MAESARGTPAGASASSEQQRGVHERQQHDRSAQEQARNAAHEKCALADDNRTYWLRTKCVMNWPKARDALPHSGAIRMCNLYSLSKGQAAIRELVSVWTDRTGNLAAQPAIFPDQSAPVIRAGDEGRELVMMRWGMPSPSFALKTRKTDPGVTNIRNLGSSHWRRWLGPEHRCLVPLTLPPGANPV